MKKEFHFPTILGVLVLIAGTTAAIILFKNNSNQVSQASTDCSPGSVQITNITDKSVDISFNTNSSCIAAVTVNNRLIQDARDTSGANSYTSQTHYFMADGLSANTSYTYTITGSKNTFTNNAYKFTTATKPQSAIPTSNLAWGKIYKRGKIPADSAIIYIDIPGASPLSSFVTSSGNWNISLANTYNEAKTDWFIPPENTEENITIISQDKTPLLLTGNTSYNNPVPDIILGQTTVLSFKKLTPQATPTTQIISTPTMLPLARDLTITSPAEGETIPATTAQFIGSGSPNTVLSLQLKPLPLLTGNITVGPDGTWSWSLSQKLTVGQKILVAVANNQTVTRTFMVSNNLSGPAFVASPSAGTTITSIPPTSVPTLIPTTTPKPTRVSQPSTSSGVPVTGDSTPTILITVTGIIITFIALLLFR